MLLQSAGLLEDAMDHSPHDPHLKIAAISIYAKLNAASRALAVFQDMGVK
jgi:N-terminal acetyltransferase B complex non-catalytic subunit